MRIVVVRPTHPDKGGVAAHTTRTAQALADAGRDYLRTPWTAYLAAFAGAEPPVGSPC
jgi:hypothetical protein